MNRCFLRIDGLKPQQAASCWWGLCCLLIAQPVEVLTEQLLLGERHMCVVLACFSAISRKRCEATLVAPFNCWGTGDAFLSVQEPKWCFARDRPYLACSVVFKTVQDVLYIIIVKEVNLRPLIRPWFFFFFQWVQQFVNCFQEKAFAFMSCLYFWYCISQLDHC